jgi:asparagine synthase (glutamine-hydrolysing)
MCGITGIWQHDGRAVDVASLHRATTSLRHRGPDDEGYLLVKPDLRESVLCGGVETDAALRLPPVGNFNGQQFSLALGFRRLSILDLSPAGHQPMPSADERCWIIFNGEIYNYLELRRELIAEGYEFRTGTDTEVVLAAYQHWGIDCLQHFNGMWAFALWDSRKRQLFLSRDRFGIKPLFYVNDGGHFLFASEIKALFQYPGVSRHANPRRLYEYLRSGKTDYGEETLFEGIRQVPAAHLVVISADNPRVAEPKCYWKIDADRHLDISFEEAASQLRELFLESARLHLRSDVRVGAALSGGIDSSAIVGSMRVVDPALELHTFSYMADDPAVSEERWVNIVGAATQVEIHKVHPTAADLVADLDHLITAQDEPFGSTSIYAQYRVFRLAHESGIKVMLEGQGADEMLAGYHLYLVARLGSLLRRGRLLDAYRFHHRASRLPGLIGSRLLPSAAGFLLPFSLQQMAARGFGRNKIPAWLNGDWFFRQGVMPEVNFKSRGKNPLQQLLYSTMTEGSLPMLLRFGDRSSMAFSIESRVPFLTADLAEFVLALPEEYLIAPDGTSKHVFRHAMRGIVPDAVLDRRDKVAFATPERSWLTTLLPWLEKVLGSDTAKRIPALNLPMMKDEWEAILSGRRPFDYKVWRWLNVVRWAECLEVSF